MPTRRRRKSVSIATQSAQLAWAVPQVVAHRIFRMALAGPQPTDRDQKEMQLMVSEKQDAFAQAWSAMAQEAMRANQAMAASLWTAFLNPFVSLSPRGRMSVAALAAGAQSAALGVVAAGLAPVRRKAVSNAARLAKSRRR